MPTIPESLQDDFRIASTHEIRSWSFGQVTAVRPGGSTANDHVPGTLHDQATFGPVQDYHCACAKYVGDRFSGMICDRCGVKVCLASVRWVRFGHVELPAKIAHPFAESAVLDCFPVMPAMLLMSPAGEEVALRYEQLFTAVSGDDLNRAVREIVDILLPAVIEANRWYLPSTLSLAQGLALHQRDA